MERTTSAARLTGGVGSIIEPTVRDSGLAARSQLRIVCGQARKARAVSAALQASKVLELEDAEALRGREVGSVPFGDLGESRREQLSGFRGEPGAKLGFLHASLKLRLWIDKPAQTAQVSAGGEAEEASSQESCPQRQPMGWFAECWGQA